MSTTKPKNSLVLISAILVALIAGVAVGYYARAGEVSSLMNENAMMRQETQSMTVAFKLTPGNVPMPPHDIWLVIAPLGGGDFAVIFSAQGLEGNGSYLIEGVERGGQMNHVPIAGTVGDSEFGADMHGNGLYWHVVMSDPRVTYEQIILLYLPNMQMQNAQQVASANLS